MLTVSVVVPAHNEERRIGRCIAALRRELEESGVRGEILVVDNASSDGTREEALKHPGVTVVDERFKGRVQARRAGVVVAGGDLIACVDADAVVAPGWLARAVAEFKKNEKLSAVSGPMRYPRLDAVDRALVALGQALAYGAHALCGAALGTPLLFESGNCVMRREALRRAGAFAFGGDFWGDDARLLRGLCAQGEVKWMPGLRTAASARRLRREGVAVAGARYAWQHATALFSAR